MNMKGLAVGLSMVLLMAVALGSAEAKEAKPFHSEDSGSYVSGGTPIDTGGDGRTADLVLTSGKGSHLGETTTQSVVEWGPFDYNPSGCLDGKPFHAQLAGGGFVIRAANGDLLFGTFSTGTNCADFPTTSGIFSLTGTFTGGTGKFAGASGGSLTVTGTAVPVVGPDSLGHQFGSVVSRTEGILP